MGWHGNTREWCMRLTCASLAPVLSTVVLDLAGGSLPQGNWRVRVLSGLCTREFNDLWSRHPVCIAHLRCAFLIMSGGHHVNACFDQMLCLCDGAGDHDRQIPNQLLSLQRSPTPAVMSILPVGPPPWVRRALSRRVGSSLSRKPRRVFVPVFRPARRDRAGAYRKRRPAALVSSCTSGCRMRPHHGLLLWSKRRARSSLQLKCWCWGPT